MGRRWWVLAVVAAHSMAATAATQAPAPKLGEVEIIGTGPTTLLAIPCASCRWRSFDEFAERNADRFTTVAVTLPGYGGSPLPDLPSYGAGLEWHRNAVDALEGLLEDRDLTDVVVVGHSFGSSIALRLASRNNDRIRGFVNLDGSLLGPPERSEQSIEERLLAAASIREEYMEPLADPDEWQRFNTPSIGRPERRLLYHGWFMDTDRAAVLQYWWDNLLLERNSLVKGLAIPVLDVQLYPSASAGAARARERYEGRIRQVGLGSNYRVLFYAGVGHFLMEDAPELLDALLTQFASGAEDYPPGMGQ